MNDLLESSTFNDFYDMVNPLILNSEVSIYKKLELLRNYLIIEAILEKKFSSDTELLKALDDVLIARKTLINMI